MNIFKKAKAFKRGLVLMGLTAFIFTSCEKDKKINEDMDETPVTDLLEEQDARLDKIINKTTVKAFIQGYVLDKEGIPIKDVEIIKGSEKMETDEHGYFVFQETEVNKDLAIIKAEKKGYFKGIRTFTPTIDAANTVEIILQEKGAIKTLDASAGGVLTFDKDVKLDFPANSIKDLSGNLYADDVKIHLRFINPHEDDAASLMPGNLVGLQENDEFTSLFSNGMIEVEMVGNKNQPLQIADNKAVTITMPVATNSNTPDELPIWYFNEKYGVWVETGVIQNKGNSSTFQVYHFSSWIIAHFERASISKSTVKLKTNPDQTLNNQKINIYSSDFNYLLKTVYTDNQGEFDLIHAPHKIGVKVVLECEDNSEGNVISLSQGKKITETLHINSNRVQNYSLKGTIKDCEGATHQNTYLSLRGLENDKINFSGQTDKDGNFTTSFMLCDVASNQSEEVVAAVFTSDNTIKRDTFNLVFNGNKVSADFNLCKSEDDDTSLPHLNPTLTYGSVTDIEGNKYATIKIGEQTWMAENLRTSKYKDGMNIPHIKDNSDWAAYASDKKAASAFYDNDESNAPLYGMLYNWYAAETGKLCPEGWHIPSDEEWDELTDFLGGEDEAGKKMKTPGNIEESTGLWIKDAGYKAGTNESGFSAQPGGVRMSSGHFYNMGMYGMWWSSTVPNRERPSPYPSYRQLMNRFDAIQNLTITATMAHSCRCVKD